MDTYRGNMTHKIADWRLQFFREQLYVTTYRMYLKSREDIKELSPDLYDEMCLSDDDDNNLMTSWPDFFEVDNVAPVRKTDLKQKPRLNNFKSMESLL